MKLKSVRRFALFIGTFLAAIQLIIFFALVFDNRSIDVLESDFNTDLYIFVVPAILMIITWINNRFGAILLILVSVVFLFLPGEYGQFESWLQLSAPFLIVGLMLLNYYYYNVYVVKKRSK